MKTNVLIVSKTRMGNDSVCLGGLDLSNNMNVRLFDKKNNSFNANTSVNIGQVWEMEYVASKKIAPPHTEDVCVGCMALKDSVNNIRNFLRGRITAWKGDPHNLFDRLICISSRGTGYISVERKIPDRSVGFWIPHKDLRRDDFGVNIKYRMYDPVFRIKYVGVEEPLDRIPAGTLLRVSLARWWLKPDDNQEKCYLQLSGWYS